MWLGSGAMGPAHWADVALLGSLMLHVIEGGRSGSLSLSKCKVELSSILQSFPDAVFLFDRQARIADWNATAEELAGPTANELSGLDADAFSRLLSRDDKPAASEPLALRALRGESVRHERCFLQSGNGDRMEVLVSESPVRDAAKRIIGALVVVQDVTELSALQREIASSERHFAVGQMTAGLAHDFNNVLNTISEATYVIEGEQGLTERDRSMLATIQNGVRRGAEIVGNIRDFLRGNREARSHIDLRHLLQDVLQLAKPLLEVHQGITLTTNFADNCQVCGNAPELRRVFMNLILNAIDAMSHGGTLSVACFRDASRVLVSMKDTGLGIPPEVQKLIFSPYFTTKSKGTGLGLAGARRTLHSQGGDIRFESSPGQGTTFYVVLPRADKSEHQTYRAA